MSLAKRDLLIAWYSLFLFHHKTLLALARYEVKKLHYEQRKQINYRGFIVGCAVLVMNPRGKLAMFAATNLMPCEGGCKACAEDNALKRASAAGYYTVLGIVVVGKPQADGESGKVSPTLHPCGGCRRDMLCARQLSPYTPVLSASVKRRGPKEWHTLIGLAKFHKTRMRR